MIASVEPGTKFLRMGSEALCAITAIGVSQFEYERPKGRGL